MVSMATRSVILLKHGTTHTNLIISQRLFILETKLGTKLKLRHWHFIPLSNIQTTIQFLINAQAFLDPLLSKGRRVAKVLTKYIFKQLKHYICFITSVLCLATLGTFVSG